MKFPENPVVGVIYYIDEIGYKYCKVTGWRRA